MRQVIVTGASKGIGLAICNTLADAGHKVIGLSRSGAEHNNAEFETGDHGNGNSVDHIAHDLQNIDATSRRITQLCTNNPIDAIICNAGAGLFGSIENYSAAAISQQIILNLISPLVVVRAAMPYLKKQKRSDIIFIGSESALQGGRYGSIYSAAKFGLRGAAQALRQECVQANCHVGIVHPGMVRTGFFDRLDFEPGDSVENALQPEDVAVAVMGLLDAPDHAVIEEITLNPLKHVVKKKSSSRGKS